MQVALEVAIDRLHLPRLLGQLHLQKNERVAGGRRLHLCRVRRFRDDVLDYPCPQVATTELLDRGRLLLLHLPHTAVVGLLRRIPEDFNLEVRVLLIEEVPLPNDAPLALLDVAWPPRHIDMVLGHQAALHVRSCTSLDGRRESDPCPALIHVVVQLRPLRRRLAIVHEPNLMRRNAKRYQLRPDVVVDAELAVIGKQIIHRNDFFAPLLLLAGHRRRARLRGATALRR